MPSVNIKDLHVDMEVKTRGVEFEVHNSSGKHMGDLVVKKNGLVWCKGKTKPENGEHISWDKFIDWMENGD